jgi:hypothetical protein
MFLRHKHPERSQVLAGCCAFGFRQLLSDGRLEVEILEVDGGGVGRIVLGDRGMFVGFHARHHETVFIGVKGGASSAETLNLEQVIVTTFIDRSSYLLDDAVPIRELVG